MSYYFISYDIRENGDYKPITDTLIEYGAIRMLQSTWCFEYDKNKVRELRDYFIDFVDTSKDGLVIVEASDFCRFNTDDKRKK